MRLKDKIAIVTGGGQGIGRGIALQFAREGASLTIAQRTAEKLEQTRTELEALGAQVLAIETDVGKTEDVQRMVDATQERFGGLDILVNNAGVGLHVPIDEVEMDDFTRLMDTNLKGMYWSCRCALPLLKQRGGGSIINISSVHGVSGYPSNTVYAATKGGIIGCTRALAAELAPFAIRVNAISPGAIQIGEPMEHLRQHIKPEFHAEFMRLFKDRMAAGRKYYQPLEVVGVPQDIAYGAVYLAADEARFLTGQNLTIDGGLTSTLSPLASDAARAHVEPFWDEIRAWIEAHKAEATE